jgi:hypothetical protein
VSGMYGAPRGAEQGTIEDGASAPDLSERRTHAESVAYGKLLAVREIIDKLAKQQPGAFEKRAYHDGYARAVQIVKGMRLGVDK